MDQGWIPLSDPDISQQELDAVRDALISPRLSQGPLVAAFETAFSTYTDRRHGVAVPSHPGAVAGIESNGYRTGGRGHCFTL